MATQRDINILNARSSEQFAALDMAFDEMARKSGATKRNERILMDALKASAGGPFMVPEIEDSSDRAICKVYGLGEQPRPENPCVYIYGLEYADGPIDVTIEGFIAGEAFTLTASGVDSDLSKDDFTMAVREKLMAQKPELDICEICTSCLKVQNVEASISSALIS